MSQPSLSEKDKLKPRALAAAELIRAGALILSANGDPTAIHALVDQAIEDAVQERLSTLSAPAPPVAESVNGEKT